MIEARQNIIDACREVHDRAGNVCQFQGCHKRSVMVSHRIKKGVQGRRAIKSYLKNNRIADLKIWGETMNKIIHNKLNTVATCENFAHNSSFLISSKVPFDKLVTKIWSDLKK